MTTRSLRAACLLMLAFLAGCSSTLHRPALPAVHADESISAPTWRYLLSEAQLQSMANHDDVPRLRSHAWQILADMVADSPQLVGSGNSAYAARWDVEPWENKCTLGLGGSTSICPITYDDETGPCPLPLPKVGATNVPRLETPIQQLAPQLLASTKAHPRVPPVPRVTTGPGPFLSSVRYNAFAAEFIRRKCLYLRPRIQELAADLSHPSFDPRSVIVKLMFAIPSAQGSYINVWDPALAANRSELPGGPSDWPLVKVDMTGKPCNARGYRATPLPAPGAPVTAVPLDCFYHREYPCEMISGTIKPPSTNTVQTCLPGHTFQALLLGVHIITAEQRDWVWNTFWWTPDPERDDFRDSPPDIQRRGPWRFYGMNTTVNPTRPIDRADHRNPVAFNPYIEGRGRNYTSSNCMFCHRLAVMREKNTPVPVGQDLATGSPPRELYNPNRLVPAAGDPYFRGATPTHLLWSVADNTNEALRDNIQNSHLPAGHRP